MILIENTSASVTGVSNLVINTGFQPKNVILRPGINSITDEIWNALKSLPMIKDKIAHGIIKVALEGNEAEDVNDSLNALHYTQANKIIKATYDLTLLENWRATETRAAVLKSIDAQIKTLEVHSDDDKPERFL